MLEEGWAKYCEYRMCHDVLQDQGLVVVFRQGLRKSLLLAIATILIHYCGRSINQTIERLSIYCTGSETMTHLRNVCLQSYNMPIESISYALGYSYVRSVMNEREKVMTNDILNLYELR